MTLRGHAHFPTQKEKPNDGSLERDAAEAKRLGLSYGTYMGYKATGYLEEYVRRKKKEDFRKALSKENVIASKIIGG